MAALHQRGISLPYQTSFFQSQSFLTKRISQPRHSSVKEQRHEIRNDSSRGIRKASSISDVDIQQSPSSSHPLQQKSTVNSDQQKALSSSKNWSGLETFQQKVLHKTHFIPSYDSSSKDNQSLSRSRHRHHHSSKNRIQSEFLTPNESKPLEQSALNEQMHIDKSQSDFIDPSKIQSENLLIKEDDEHPASAVDTLLSASSAESKSANIDSESFFQESSSANIHSENFDEREKQEMGFDSGLSLGSETELNKELNMVDTSDTAEEKPLNSIFERVGNDLEENESNYKENQHMCIDPENEEQSENFAKHSDRQGYQKHFDQELVKGFSYFTDNINTDKTTKPSDLTVQTELSSSHSFSQLSDSCLNKEENEELLQQNSDHDFAKQKHEFLERLLKKKEKLLSICEAESDQQEKEAQFVSKEIEERQTRLFSLKQLQSEKMKEVELKMHTVIEEDQRVKDRINQVTSELRSLEEKNEKFEELKEILKNDDYLPAENARKNENLSNKTDGFVGAREKGTLSIDSKVDEKESTAHFKRLLLENKSLRDIVTQHYSAIDALKKQREEQDRAAVLKIEENAKRIELLTQSIKTTQDEVEKIDEELGEMRFRKMKTMNEFEILLKEIEEKEDAVNSLKKEFACHCEMFENTNHELQNVRKTKHMQCLTLHQQLKMIHREIFRALKTQSLLRDEIEEDLERIKEDIKTFCFKIEENVIGKEKAPDKKRKITKKANNL
ncbi:uncharacterized protein MONOS_14549 [Monocercomonoides exilis]|uniref:uncharacterized protein n=1 Tax=Monocercomonoides exilis TaxID=2049356 RepID=UPI00355ABDD4|nr:hypothetical protein MONOS_14549 [Monocercomonoides exilis]|eukprot:MONOS_14549.1-p1 / transcript=MONOS_14549.1 / gene=MONOS_14549 / organism=Monocercomonoides_exilis_PA203 / gene_product=unspecified product / transcript_product=unspecified product / location=Mono_scaffold01022:4047-6320(-) / protein_length=729 / sequence_SO=supercontig / SO=protein_coding / is_pseudo=false